MPLYDTLGENAVEFIINHSESAIVFTSAANLPKLVKALPSIQDQLKTVVYWGKPDAQSERVSLQCYMSPLCSSPGMRLPQEAHDF